MAHRRLSFGLVGARDAAPCAATGQITTAPQSLVARIEIPGTGHLERILFNEKMQELRREALLRELRQRIRDVRQGPDGLLYLLTDEKEGAVLRIEPAN